MYAKDFIDIMNHPVTTTVMSLCDEYIHNITAFGTFHSNPSPGSIILLTDLNSIDVVIVYIL